MYKKFKPRIVLKVLACSLGIAILIVPIAYRVKDQVDNQRSIAKSIAEYENQPQGFFSALNGYTPAPAPPPKLLSPEFIYLNVQENAALLGPLIGLLILLLLLLKRKIVFTDTEVFVGRSKISKDTILLYNEDKLSTKDDKDFCLHLESYAPQDRYEIEELLHSYTLKK